jgi:hypothetical protein
MNNWISVKDKLPDTRKRVLATNKEIVLIAWLKKNSNLWEGWQLLDGEYFTYVTHWMPLPNPPDGI